MELLSTAPELLAGYLRAGGPVVVALLVSTFFLWTLILERLFFFYGAQKGLIRELQQMWQERRDHSSWYAHAIRERLISELRVASERYLGVIKVLILVTPLLGLLGTVTGMIEVFQVITATDGADARSMASGISRATIPTMTGLAVSLTGVFAINVLDRRLSRSVGGLADGLEIQHVPRTA